MLEIRLRLQDDGTVLVIPPADAARERKALQAWAVEHGTRLTVTLEAGGKETDLAHFDGRPDTPEQGRQ